PLRLAPACAAGDPACDRGGGGLMTDSDPRQTEQNVRVLDTTSVDAFLEIAPEGTVTVYSGKVELGTGVQTALGQIVAEELGVAFDRVHVVMGDTALTPDQGVTAGSKTLQVAGPVLRNAAAKVRELLLERAAEQLEVS